MLVASDTEALEKYRTMPSDIAENTKDLIMEKTGFIEK